MSFDQIRFIDSRVLQRHSLKGESIASEAQTLLSNLPDVEGKSVVLEIPQEPSTEDAELVE